MTKKILVVDDEAMIVELLLEILTDEGFNVWSAYSGEEALNVASAEKFHLIAMDASLPGMNGLDTFTAIKNKQPDILGVLITGHNTMDTAVKAINLGFDGLLQKPFTPDDLVEVVNKSLNKLALLEENARLNALIPLFNLGKKFITSYSEEKILHELIDTIAEQTGAQRISIMLYDKSEEILKLAAARGIDKKNIPDVKTRPEEKIAHWVFSQAKPLVLNYGADSDPKFEPFLKTANLATAVSLPMKTRDTIIGVMTVGKVKQLPPFKQSDIEMLSVICSQAVMAIENVREIKKRAEKERIQTLFEQYVAPEIAEVLTSHGNNPLDIGKTQNMTILFADIRNLTLLVQQIPIETVRLFLNDFFELLTQVIFDFKGILDKFMGDAVLGLFGGPIPLDHPEEAAVSAAIDLRERFQTLQKKWIPTNHNFKIVSLGIGISSGELFLGNLGSVRRLDFTVIGSDVNLAKRLAYKAKSTQILVSKKVTEQLGPKFIFNHKLQSLSQRADNPIPVFSVTEKKI